MSNKIEMALYDSLMGAHNYCELWDWWTLSDRYSLDPISPDGGPKKAKWIFCGGESSTVKKSSIHNMPDTEISVFTEKDIASPLVDAVKSKYKIAWLHECRGIHPWAYNLILQTEHKFDYIITFDEHLLKRKGKYTFGLTPGGSHLQKHDIQIFPKSKFMSMIVSKKGKDVVISNQARGHFLRHVIAEYLIKKQYNIDLWGKAYKPFPVDRKIDTFKDYHFSLVVMNSSHKNYFTEVLSDCFRTGTVPILWGCDNVGEFFNEKGIIGFETPAQLKEILSTLTTQDYYDRMEYIKDNFQRAEEYWCLDDRFVDKLIELDVVGKDGNVK